MDDLEKDVEAVIAACEGNLRDTVRALVVANRLLEQELSEVYAAVSKGYRRKAG